MARFKLGSHVRKRDNKMTIQARIVNLAKILSRRDRVTESKNGHSFGPDAWETIMRRKAWLRAGRVYLGINGRDILGRPIDLFE